MPCLNLNAGEFNAGQPFANQSGIQGLSWQLSLYIHTDKGNVVTTTAKTKSYYTVGVLGKAFSVIEIMSRESKWELGRLATTVGIPKGTLQRILLTLAELGYVSRNRGQYALTLEFYRLGQRIASNNNLLEHARPLCRRLMQSVNETVSLCVALNTEMVVIDQQVSLQMPRLDALIGSSFPIFQSAAGKVWCAFLDELHLFRLLQEIRRKKPTIEQQAVDSFLAELDTVRLEGMGFDREVVFPGLHCASAPVFDSAGKVAATVDCAVPTVRLSAEKVQVLVQELADCAAQISRSLGAKPHNFTPADHHSLLNAEPAD